jgi:hypothetical protein
MEPVVRDTISERIKSGHTKAEVVAEFVAIGHEAVEVARWYDQLESQASGKTEDFAQTVDSVSDDLSLSADWSADTYALAAPLWVRWLQIIGLVVAGLIVISFLVGVALGGPLKFLLNSAASAPYHDEAELIQGVVAGLGQTKAFGFSVDYELELSPKDPATPVLERVELNEIINELAAANIQIPSAGHAKLRIYGLVDQRDETNVKFDINTQVNLQLEPALLKASASARLVDGALYAKVSQLPTMFAAGLDGFPLDEWVFITDQSLMPDLLPANLYQSATGKGLPLALGAGVETWGQLAQHYGGVLAAGQSLVERPLGNVSQLASVLQSASVNAAATKEKRFEYQRRALVLLEQYPPFSFVSTEPVREVVSETEEIFVYQVNIDYQNLRQLAVAWNTEFADIVTPLSTEELLAALPSAEAIDQFNQWVTMELRVYPSGALAGVRLVSRFGLPGEGEVAQLRALFQLNLTESAKEIEIVVPVDLYEKTLEDITVDRFEKKHARARDQLVKQALADLQSHARKKIGHDLYSVACSDHGMQLLLEDLLAHYPQTFAVQFDVSSTESAVTCNDAPRSYAILAPLLSAADRAWCVDGTGFSGEVSATALTDGADTVCR